MPPTAAQSGGEGSRLDDEGGRTKEKRHRAREGQRGYGDTTTPLPVNRDSRAPRRTATPLASDSHAPKNMVDAVKGCFIPAELLSRGRKCHKSAPRRSPTPTSPFFEAKVADCYCPPTSRCVHQSVDNDGRRDSANSEASEGIFIDARLGSEEREWERTIPSAYTATTPETWSNRLAGSRTGHTIAHSLAHRRVGDPLVHSPGDATHIIVKVDLLAPGRPVLATHGELAREAGTGRNLFDFVTLWGNVFEQGQVVYTATRALVHWEWLQECFMYEELVPNKEEWEIWRGFRRASPATRPHDIWWDSSPVALPLLPLLPRLRGRPRHGDLNRREGHCPGRVVRRHLEAFRVPAFKKVPLDDHPTHILILLDSASLDIHGLPRQQLNRQEAKLLATDLVALYGTVVETGTVIQNAEKTIVPAECGVGPAGGAASTPPSAGIPGPSRLGEHTMEELAALGLDYVGPHASPAPLVAPGAAPVGLLPGPSISAPPPPLPLSASKPHPSSPPTSLGKRKERLAEVGSPQRPARPPPFALMSPPPSGVAGPSNWREAVESGSGRLEHTMEELHDLMFDSKGNATTRSGMHQLPDALSALPTTPIPTSPSRPRAGSKERSHMGRKGGRFFPPLPWKAYMAR
ncbi:hypothetical protein DB88DRAFT_544331 [Papiliotrema laurentii]|uniref:Uncharacterized protein n=1 Tax=Papiliotrema laurentii TaxID=5418 RepID=A0AAD9FTN3_PAPLA|nr:hypothetical protein DB88DRAFT_544331 [Papiliotrema laurentii]